MSTLKRTTLPDVYRVCIASLITSIQLALPIAKVMSKLGSVIVITEDRSWMSLSPSYDDDFDLGNIKVKIVDFIDDCEEEPWYEGEYTFHLYVCSSFIPQVKVDKYILYTSRELYRTQIKSLEYSNKPIYTCINMRLIDPKLRESIKKAVFIQETQIDLGNSSTYAKYIDEIIYLKKTSLVPPSTLANFIETLLDGHQDLTKKDIRLWLREEISAL